MSIKAIFLIIFASFWTCHDARDTLKAGDTLNSSSSLVSASGKFNLSFVEQDISGTKTTYLAILRNKEKANKAWIGNKNSPIPYPSSPILTLDTNNTLKIAYPGGGPIEIYSAPPNSTSGLVATLLNSGNLVIQESSSGVNGSVLWQSFDHPTDTFLPGMKLGVDHRNGKNWSLLSWATSYNPAPGPFTLDWDTDRHQLTIKQGGVVYWTSGVFADGKFQFILPDVSYRRYNFSLVSNQNEDYLTYSAVDDPSDSEPEWVLYSRGELFEYGASDSIMRVWNCDGYNTGDGCVRRDRPKGCMANFGDGFALKNGYFKINNSSNSSRPPNWFNVSGVDCKVTCWQDCNCVGFDTPRDNQSSTGGAGCRFWSVDNQFIEELKGSSSGNTFYVLPGVTVPTTPTATPSKENDAGQKMLWIGIATGAALFVAAICILWYLLSGENRANIHSKFLSFMKSSRPNNVHINGDKNDHGNLGRHDLSVFTYESVLAATNNFSEENKLGEGGFGPVYKGKLLKGQEIAVKRLSRSSGQGISEFKNELILIHELQHTNLVHLFGSCIHEQERMLIYEYLPNKSLDCFLFDSIRSGLLDWKKRFSIIEGITQGLLYLHRYSRTKVIHRDLKASNILLDENMNPKISDFGLARIFSETELEESTSRIVGTRGYMAPETIEGIVSVKSDVYGFGVLMLEIISGRKNNSFYNDDDRLLNLVGHAWELWKESAPLELMDPTLSDSCNGNQLLRCIHVGLLCVEENAADRPTMSDVISMLTNESMELPKPKKPAFYTEANVADTDVDRKGPQIIGSVNGLSHSDFDAR